MSKVMEIRKTNMIKTLRITGVMVAVLAAGLFVFPAVFGFRGDGEIGEFLNLPSVVEQFRKARTDNDKKSEGRISPLVQQAEAFGLYLNPPAPVKPVRRARVTPTTHHIPKPEPRRTTPKFKLIATSFYASRPELSLALIDEPGIGRHWVRQSSEVSHLAIEQIKDGLLVVKGGGKTFEIRTVPRPPQRSLVAGSSPVSLRTGSHVGTRPAPVTGTSGAGSAKGTTAGTTDSGIGQMSPEEQAALAEKIFAELAAMSAEAKSTESAPAAKSPVSTPKDMRIGGKEAGKLGSLGRQLKNNPANVKQDPNRPKSPKVSTSSKKSWKPGRAARPSKSKQRPSSRKQAKRKRK